jgi:hypothetical protein
MTSGKGEPTGYRSYSREGRGGSRLCESGAHETDCNCHAKHPTPLADHMPRPRFIVHRQCGEMGSPLREPERTLVETS